MAVTEATAASVRVRERGSGAVYLLGLSNGFLLVELCLLRCGIGEKVHRGEGELAVSYL